MEGREQQQPQQPNGSAIGWNSNAVRGGDGGSDQSNLDTAHLLDNIVPRPVKIAPAKPASNLPSTSGPMLMGNSSLNLASSGRRVSTSTPVHSIQMPADHPPIIQNIVVSVENTNAQPQQSTAAQPIVVAESTAPSSQAANKTPVLVSGLVPATPGAVASGGKSFGILTQSPYILPNNNLLNSQSIKFISSPIKIPGAQMTFKPVATKQQQQPQQAGSSVTALLLNTPSVEQQQQPQQQQQQQQPRSGSGNISIAARPSSSSSTAAQEQPQQQQHMLFLSPFASSPMKFPPGATIKIPSSPNKRPIAPKLTATPFSTTSVGSVVLTGKPPQQQQHVQLQAAQGKNVQIINSFVRSPGTVLPPGTSAKNVTIVSSSTGKTFVPIKPLQLGGSAGGTVIVNSKPMGSSGQGSIIATGTVGSSSVGKGNFVQFGNKQVLINQKSTKGSWTVCSEAGGSSSGPPTKRMATGPMTISGTSGVPMKMMMMKTAGGQMVKTSPKVVCSGGDAPKYIPIAPNPGISTGGALGNICVQPTVNVQVINTEAGVVTKKVIEPKLADTQIGDGTQETRRRPCNCTRSQCLKLYCECFANGEFCQNCNCNSCYNNLENEDRRKRAIRMCLERNPNAFHPKIGQAAESGEVDRMHTKGCNCKRSGCLKNYCECYEAKILCSDRCRCVACKNYEENTERKTLETTTVRLEMEGVLPSSHRFGSHTAVSTAKFPAMWESDIKMQLPIKVKPDCPPFYCLTPQLLDSIGSCLMAVAEEGEYEEMEPEAVQEHILREFGECLNQILSIAHSSEEEKQGKPDN